MHDSVRLLVQVAGNQKALATALDMSERQISQIAQGHQPVPEYFSVIAELIAVVPPKDWPARWKQSGTSPSARSG